jgi:hypothetical protein
MTMARRWREEAEADIGPNGRCEALRLALGFVNVGPSRAGVNLPSKASEIDHSETWRAQTDSFPHQAAAGHSAAVFMTPRRI